MTQPRQTVLNGADQDDSDTASTGTSHHQRSPDPWRHFAEQDRPDDDRGQSTVFDAPGTPGSSRCRPPGVA